MNVRHPLLLLLVAATALVGGCDDDPVEPDPVVRRTAILAVNAVTQEPIPGVELLLYDLGRGRPAAPPLITAETGWAGTEGLDSGPHAWFVMPGQGWLPMKPPVQASISSGDIQTPYVSAIQLLAVQPGGDPVVSGTVFDRVSGEPVSGVSVGHPGWPTAWDGLDETNSDVTGADGVFRAMDVVFARELGSDDIFQVHPLVFQAPGYRPRSLRFDAPGGDRVVRLTPLSGDGADTGALRGRVVSREGPVAGLGLVGTWVDPGGKSWLPHPGVVAETSADGTFVLDDLAAGAWFVKPGYLPADGWTLIPGLDGHDGSLPAQVAAGDTVDVGDLHVLPAIPPRFPGPGATQVDSLPVFRWTAVAEADSYDVFVGGWYLGRTAADSLAVPEEFPLSQGAWGWYMNARSAAGELVAMSETRYRFIVGPFGD